MTYYTIICLAVTTTAINYFYHYNIIATNISTTSPISFKNGDLQKKDYMYTT